MRKSINPPLPVDDHSDVALDVSPDANTAMDGARVGATAPVLALVALLCGACAEDGAGVEAEASGTEAEPATTMAGGDASPSGSTDGQPGAAGMQDEPMPGEAGSESGAAGSGAANPDGFRGPATRVHVDYTPKSGPQRAKDSLGGQVS